MREARIWIGLRTLGITAVITIVVVPLTFCTSSCYLEGFWLWVFPQAINLMGIVNLYSKLHLTWNERKWQFWFIWLVLPSINLARLSTFQVSLLRKYLQDKYWWPMLHQMHIIFCGNQNTMALLTLWIYNLSRIWTFSWGFLLTLLCLYDGSWSFSSLKFLSLSLWALELMQGKSWEILRFSWMCNTGKILHSTVFPSLIQFIFHFSQDMKLTYWSLSPKTQMNLSK